MHSLDDAFFSTDLAPSTLFTPHFDGGLDVGPRLVGSGLGERSPLEGLASWGYGSRYQRPYDPDPGEPDAFAPAYTPYEPELPAPARTPRLFPPPDVSELPLPPEPRYEDSLMSDEWLNLLLDRLPSPVEGLVNQDEPGWLGGVR
jgi:hypothetical protein